MRDLRTPTVFIALACFLGLDGLVLGQGLRLPARKLAPDVLTVIEPDPVPQDTSVGPIDLSFVSEHPERAWIAPEFAENKPNFAPASETLLELSRSVTLRHPVYQLEFAFKPVRTIEVAIASSAGEVNPTLIWYLLYRVRYLGNDITPEVVESDSQVRIPQEPRRTRSDAVLFAPKFDLIARQVEKVYQDRVLPSAISAIAERERVGKPIYDSFEMFRKIQLTTPDQNNEVWGVATWIGVDPRTDFFTVAVEGLTNGYQVVTTPDGPKYEKRSLMINFWRPGDSYQEDQDEILLGVPAYEEAERLEYALEQLKVEERVAYFWAYR